MKYLVRLWDCLIANADRTQQNILLTEDWRTVLIDHSRAFQPAARFARQLIFGADGMQKFDDGRPLLIRLVPRAAYDRIMALDAKAVRGAAGAYLDEAESTASSPGRPDPQGVKWRRRREDRCSIEIVAEGGYLADRPQARLGAASARPAHPGTCRRRARKT
jgi:hypothetical protein